MVFGGQGQGYNLGDAQGRIILDASGVQAGVNQAQRAFSNFTSGISSNLASIGTGMQNLGRSLTIATAPLAAGLAGGVRAFANYEEALIEIQARAGLTAEELEQVRQKTLDIGRDTAFSASQGADAFLQLLTSGQSLAEAMETIDSVMIGAAASGADLGFTADALTDILAMFSNQGANSAEVLRALTRASGSSSATFEDLVQGFQNAGGVASQFGLSVWDTAAILATFAENGIKGAEAGTQLRSMLNNMTRDVDDVNDTWRRLGISMFDAQGNARPLSDVMDELRVALAGMTDEERIETIKTLGGSFGQLGLAALTVNSDFMDMSDSMRNAADASAVAEARMQGLNGAIRFLKGSVETFFINALGPLVQNYLEPFIRRVADAVNVVSEWAKANPEAAEKIGLIAVALVALGPALTILGKLLVLLSGGVIPLAGFAALGLAIHNNWLGIGDLFRDFEGTLRTAAETAQLIATVALLALSEGLTQAGIAAQKLIAIVLLEAQQALIDLRQWFFDNNEQIGRFTTGIIALAGAFVAVKIISLVQGLTFAVGGLAGAIRGLLLLIGGPFTIALGLAALLVLAYTNNWLGFADFINGRVRPVLLDIINLLQQIGQLMGALPGAVAGVPGEVGAIDWGGAPGRAWDVISGFPGAVGNALGLAEGGIIKSPTAAVIGEDLHGANDFEAVFNSDQLRRLLSEVSRPMGDINVYVQGGLSGDMRRKAQELAERLDEEMKGRGYRG